MANRHPRLRIILIPLLAMASFGFLVAGCGGGGGPTATITGSVVNASDPSQPIGNAYVYVPVGAQGLAVGDRQSPDAEAHTYTDESGAFTLTGVTPGDVTLAITPPAGSGLAPMEAELTVAEDAEPSVRATVVDSALVDRIASVVVNPAEVSVGLNSTWPCTVTVTDTDGQPMALTPTWTVLGTAGSVNENGLFSAGSETGVCTVVAAVGPVKGQCAVTVTDASESALALSVQFPEASASLTTATQCVKAVVSREADGTELGQVTLTPTAPTATVAGIAGGTLCRIDASAHPNTDGTGVVQASASVLETVQWGKTSAVTLALASTVTSVAVSPPSTELEPAATTQLTATALDAAASAVLVSDSWQWTTDAPLVATVDAAGLVTAVAPGSAVLTATETDSGVSGTATVTVVADFAVTPASVDFGKADATTSLAITAGGPSVTWTLSESLDWLTPSATTGTGDGTVTLTADRTGLTNGDYSGSLTVTAAGEAITVPVTMGVGPILVVTPTELDFGADELALPVTVSNAGSGYFNWSTVDPPTWITRAPGQGLANATVQVGVDRASLAPGDHEATLEFLSNGGSATVTIRATVLGATP